MASVADAYLLCSEECVTLLYCNVSMEWAPRRVSKRSQLHVWISLRAGFVLQCLRLDKENGTCLPLMLASVAEHVAGHLSATTGSRTQPLGLLGLPRRCLFETKRQQ